MVLTVHCARCGKLQDHYDRQTHGMIALSPYLAYFFLMEYKDIDTNILNHQTHMRNGFYAMAQSRSCNVYIVLLSPFPH